MTTISQCNSLSVNLADGLWLGDYFRLAPVGDSGFMSVFAAVDQNNHTSMFARQVGQ